MCSAIFNYNESCDGLLNFNNNLFITYDLLKWLRNSQYMHNALSREMQLLEFQYGISICVDVVRRAFYKFLALAQDQDSFRCPLCGDHPVILTFDVDRKCNFKLEKMEENMSDLSETVDGQKFCEDVMKHFLERQTVSHALLLRYWATFIAETSKKSGS